MRFKAECVKSLFFYVEDWGVSFNWVWHELLHKNIVNDKIGYCP
jgi:hypothetical protein